MRLCTRQNEPNSPGLTPARFVVFFTSLVPKKQKDRRRKEWSKHYTKKKEKKFFFFVCLENCVSLFLFLFAIAVCWDLFCILYKIRQRAGQRSHANAAHAQTCSLCLSHPLTHTNTPTQSDTLTQTQSRPHDSLFFL
jgi:hypothetical protein